MESTKISIIIPVYNVEQYLQDCLDSVLGQSHKNLQVILVDDGSLDNSGSICDHYAELDSRVTVLHKENRGLSSARNAGLPMAKGEFVFYLDSDDYLEPDAIAYLLQAQHSSGADMVIGNYEYTYEDHEAPAPSTFQWDTTLSREEAIEALVWGKIQNFAWGKLIRTDIAQKHYFPEGKLFEDTFWAHHVVHSSNAIHILTRPLVHYRQRNNSISYSYTINRLDILDGWHARLDFLSEEYPELVPVYLEHLVPAYLGIAWLTLTRMKKQRSLAIQKLQKFESLTHLSLYADLHQKKLIKALRCNVYAYFFLATLDRIIRR